MIVIFKLLFVVIQQHNGKHEIPHKNDNNVHIDHDDVDQKLVANKTTKR